MTYSTSIEKLCPVDPQSESKKSVVVKGMENGCFFTNDLHCFGMLETHPDRTLSEIKAILNSHKDSGREKDVLFQWLGAEQTRPLQRIFKKVPCGEGLIKKTERFKRTVMSLEIENDPGLLEEYITIHRPENMWAQVLKNMDEIGVADMELYLMGYHAFLVMDTKPDFDMEKDGAVWAEMPREAEWQRYVAKFQKTDPTSKASEKWKPLQQLI